MKNKSGQGARGIMAGGPHSPHSFPVQCGAMTVIWVSALPLKEVNAYGTDFQVVVEE